MSCDDSGEFDLGPRILSALDIKFAKGPPGTEVATTIPKQCFFPADIEDASYPDTWVKETEPKRQKIDTQSIDDPIAAFKKLTMYENCYRPSDDPGPMLQEMGLDLGTREVGKHFDWPFCLLVRTSSGGETVTVEEALRSKKHILVCCVFLPLLHSRAYHVRGISSATIELKEVYGDDMFETIIVAHMIRGWKENKDAFDRFLTAFPGCYAVPFEDQSLLEVSDWVFVPYKDSAFRRLALRFPQEEDCLLIIDPHDKVLDPHCLDIIKEFGIDSFPFTRNHIIREKVRKFRNLKLDSLFSQKVLYRNNDSMKRYSPACLGSGIVFVFFSDEGRGGQCLEALKVSLQMLRTEGPKFEAVVVLLAPTNSISKIFLSILSDEDSSWLIYPLGEPPAAVVDLAKEKILSTFLSFLDGELCSICRSGVASLREQLSRDERDELVRLQVIECYVDYGLDYMGVKPFTLQ